MLYPNGKYNMVQDLYLGNYIELDKILKFEKRDGWVTIGIDPIRGTGGTYCGQERRRVT